MGKKERKGLGMIDISQMTKIDVIATIFLACIFTAVILGVLGFVWYLIT